jgi:hypothetical protein
MRFRDVPRFAVLAVLALASFSLTVGAAQARVGAATGARAPAARQTTGPALFYTIHVTITDKRTTMSRQDLPRTYSARFDIRNVGTKTHSFTLGPKLLSKATIVSRVVKPKAHAVALFVQSDYRGVLRFYSLAPGDASNRGLQGVFTID